MAKGSKKDQNAVVSREYTINLHKRLHKTYVSRRSLISSPPLLATRVVNVVR